MQTSKPRLKTSPDICNTNDDVDSIEMELVYDAFFDNLPKEVVDLAFIEGPGKEDKRTCELISCVHHGV